MTPDSNDAGAGTRPAFDAGGEVAGDDARGEVAVALTQHDHAVADHGRCCSRLDARLPSHGPGREVEDAQAVHGFASGAGPEHGAHSIGRGRCRCGPDVAGHLRRPAVLARAGVEGTKVAAVER